LTFPLEIWLYIANRVVIATTAASLTSEQNVQIAKFGEMLVAPCCYHELISIHQSDVVIEMRREIECMVTEGKSDREILDYYIVKCGRAVLAEPQGMEGWVVRGVPFLALLLGVGLVSRLVWKWRSKIERRATHNGKSPGTGEAAQDSIPEEYRGRIERELRDRHL
jgi:cytochrome c-type biogenesis protein CcmH/NrfF